MEHLNEAFRNFVTFFSAISIAVGIYLKFRRPVITGSTIAAVSEAICTSLSGCIQQLIICTDSRASGPIGNIPLCSYRMKVALTAIGTLCAVLHPLLKQAGLFQQANDLQDAESSIANFKAE